MRQDFHGRFGKDLFFFFSAVFLFFRFSFVCDCHRISPLQWQFPPCQPTLFTWTLSCILFVRNQVSACNILLFLRLLVYSLCFTSFFQFFFHLFRPSLTPGTRRLTSLPCYSYFLRLLFSPTQGRSQTFLMGWALSHVRVARHRWEGANG